MSVGAVPTEDVPSLERLRLLLVAEGGLMASLVDAGPGREAEPAARGGHRGDGLARDGAADVGAAPEGVTAPARPHARGEPLGGLVGPAQLAAIGPRAEGHREEYELLIEAIYEGYLLHYDAPRVVRRADADLGVLAGDRLYALGLDRLVKLGDMPAVAELADVIALTALAHGDGREDLALAVWGAGARAVGWGPSAEHERAKELMRAGAPEALSALRRLAAGPAV